MGLDTSHGCWHGAYSAFMRWREKLAEVAGLPPLFFMEGFYAKDLVGGLPWLVEVLDQGDYLPETWMEDLERISRLPGFPIRWEALRPDPLHILLRHSDCNGIIESRHCGPIADSLERIVPLLPDADAGGHIGNWRAKTRTFIDGLRLAASRGEDVDFH